MKNILVTGHDGFIGALLVKLLIERGYQVTGLDTSYFDSQCQLFPEDNKIKIIKRDLRQIKEKDIEGIDAVCHLAALSNDPLGQVNPELTYDINFRSSVQLAEISKKVGVKKFIYSSSCSLYGVAGDEALDEKAEFNPITAYAKSKVKTEQQILPMGDQNFCVTALRNATAYGISPKLRLDLVVNNLMAWAMVTGQINILSDGTPWRPIVHAEDIARAFIAVIEAPRERVNKEAFNVGLDSENYRIKEIAEIIGEKLPQCKIVITGEHGSDSRSYRVDFSKIKRQLPEFKPQWSLRKGIEEVHENYLKYKMNRPLFEDRFFFRIRQIQYLMKNEMVDQQLFWR